MIPKRSFRNGQVSVVRRVTGLTKLLSEGGGVIIGIPDFSAEIMCIMGGGVWIGDCSSEVQENQNQSGKKENPFLKYFSSLVLFRTNCGLPFGPKNR